MSSTKNERHERHERRAVIIVQGAQWGSEAKGMVAGALCIQRKINFAVRTGAVNAGHTVYHKGKKYVMQQLPTGWVNPNTQLVLGPGAYINPEILKHEVEMIRRAGYNNLIFIDKRAGLHLPIHTERSAASGRHYAIGATGKGCSEAIIDRIKNRGSGGKLFVDWWKEQWEDNWMENVAIGDAADLLNSAHDVGDRILLEGTQGTLLDLYLGPYPFTTHKQCTASQWVTEAGLSPSLQYETVLVTRTYPIRVAGNSGPMPKEISWPELARRINDKRVKANMLPLVREFSIMAYENAVKSQESSGDKYRDMSEGPSAPLHYLPEDVVTDLRKLFEFTTVTKKLRRIAELDIESLKYSVMVNRPSWVCMTFLNYEYPDLWGATEAPPIDHPSWDYLMYLEDQLGVPIDGWTTGPEYQHFFYASMNDQS